MTLFFIMNGAMKNNWANVVTDTKIQIFRSNICHVFVIQNTSVAARPPLINGSGSVNDTP